MIEFHATLIANAVSEKCISFAKEIHATRLSGSLIHKQIRSAISLQELLGHRSVDPEPIFSKVAIALEHEGVSIK